MHTKQPPRRYAGETAEELKAQGYKQTSRAYGIVARVDISDDELIAWARKELPGMIESIAEHYRRCWSNDEIEGVPDEVLKQLRHG